MSAMSNAAGDDLLFEIDDLHVCTVEAPGAPSVDILKGVSLQVRPGEVHALMLSLIHI